jgi:hypothetical protein
MGEPDQQHLMQLKKYEELDRDEQLVFCSETMRLLFFEIYIRDA